MQFCSDHWQRLREAVSIRGMDHLVAKGGEEAAAALVSQLGGNKDLSNWDPLMAAHWALAGKVLERVGLHLLSEPLCPLCMVQESYDSVVDTPDFQPGRHNDAQGWVDSCMDSMLDFARKNNLVPEVQ